MVTMSDVAKAAHVSRATVSRVLSDSASVKPETRQAVMYWVKELGYEPNKLAQGLAGNHSGLIGVLVPNITNPYYSSMVEAIEEAAASEGYSIIICCSRHHQELEQRALKNLKSRKVDGVLIYPLGSIDNGTYNLYSFPVVSMGKKLENRSSILSDLENGAALIAAHFLELGHREIGYLGPTTGPEGYNKFIGFQNHLRQQHLEIKQILECPSSKDTYVNLQDIISDYCQKSGMTCTAWFAHNDVAASELLQFLHAKQVRIPQEVAVAGYDDTTIALATTPKLTSVHQPFKEIGRRAVEVLIEQITYPDTPCKTILFENKLVVRSSSLKTDTFL